MPPASYAPPANTSDSREPHPPPAPPVSFRLAREVLSGGTSTAAVSALLNPVDVIKTRRQLPGSPQTAAIARELWGAGGAAAIARLWRPGLDATIARELLYSGCTKGLYPLVRDAISGEAEPTLAQRVVAASATGFVGSIGANALDLVKIRAFANPERYPSALHALIHIGRTEGVVSALLLRGASASAPRGAVIAVGEVRQRWPLHDIVIANIIWCMAYTGQGESVGGGAYIAKYCNRVGFARGGRGNKRMIDSHNKA